jgi:hypothetical protein
MITGLNLQLSLGHRPNQYAQSTSMSDEPDPLQLDTAIFRRFRKALSAPTFRQHDWKNES